MWCTCVSAHKNVGLSNCNTACEQRHFDVLNVIPVPVVLGDKNLVYVNVEKGTVSRPSSTVLLYDGWVWVETCKTIGKDFYVCKQRHPLLSSHLLGSCAVKFLQPRRNIPSSCETLGAYPMDPTERQLMDLLCTIFWHCNGIVWKRWPYGHSVVRVAKFSMRQGCKVCNDSIVLQTNLIFE